jgi:hypothetical protein
MRIHAPQAVMGNASREPLDRVIARWADVSPILTEDVGIRYRGLWRIVRASTRPTAAEQADHFEPKEISCSLLNIRPTDVGQGTLCDFRWYYLGRGRPPNERLQYEGLVIPNVDRLEFFGRATNRNDLLTLMIWRFISNPEINDHAELADGVALSVNTAGARVRAFFVEGSEQLTGAEFDALKNTELQKIGVRLLDSSHHIIPPHRLRETEHYLREYKPIVGFFASQGA